MHTITAPPSADMARFRVSSKTAAHPRVDRERRILFGVSIIQLGQLNMGDERKWFVDEETLRRVHDLGRAKENGVKARFTHPNASGDGLGKFLGRHHNFRMGLGGATVLADLHLSSTASSSPEGDLAEYVMGLAEEDSEAFGISIVSRNDYDLMTKQRRISDGFEPIRPKHLVAADVVDEPAATRGGVFGNEAFTIATAPHQATAALNAMFADASPDVIRARVGSFLDAYLANRFGSRGGSRNVAPPAAPLVPLTLAGGVATAAFTRDEAAEFLELLPFVNEYASSVDVYASEGISLHDYLQSRLYDERGCAMAGSVDTISADLRSAMRKQSELYAQRFPIRRPGLGW